MGATKMSQRSGVLSFGSGVLSFEAVGGADGAGGAVEGSSSSSSGGGDNNNNNDTNDNDDNDNTGNTRAPLHKWAVVVTHPGALGIVLKEAVEGTTDRLQWSASKPGYSGYTKHAYFKCFAAPTVPPCQNAELFKDVPIGAVLIAINDTPTVPASIEEIAGMGERRVGVGEGRGEGSKSARGGGAQE